MTAETLNAASDPKSNIGQGEPPALSLCPNPGDDILALIYLQAKTENLLGAMFWEKTPELTAFLAWCKRPEIVTVACYCGGFIAGFGWLDNIKVRAGKKLGDAGELFFRQYQVKGVTPQFGRMLLDYAFESLKADCVYGTTPADNLPALHYMRQAGFVHLPPLPMICCFRGESCPGVLSYLTRETWESRRTAQFEVLCA